MAELLNYLKQYFKLVVLLVGWRRIGTDRITRAYFMLGVVEIDWANV